MHITVCIKQTPDSSSVYIDPITGQVDYERFVQVLNAADACAVEAAVRLKEQCGGQVTVITLGPQDAEGALRAALAIGADAALRLWNPLCETWGPFTVAAALAACIKSDAMPVPDLILCGDAASDWSSGIVGPALAEQLELPQVTGVTRLEVSAQDGQTATSLATHAQARTRLSRTGGSATTPAHHRHERFERAALSLAACAHGGARGKNSCH